MLRQVELVAEGKASQSHNSAAPETPAANSPLGGDTGREEADREGFAMQRLAPTGLAQPRADRDGGGRHLRCCTA